jgi:hypothetical protein
MSGTRHEKYPLRKSQAFVYIYRKTKNINGLPGPWIYRTTKMCLGQNVNIHTIIARIARDACVQHD